MKLNKYFLSLILLFIIISSNTSFAQNQDSLNLVKEKLTLADINPYNPLSDPQLELDSIIKITNENGKRIILQVGGNWCIWCKRLEKYFMENEDLSNLLNENYILLKVNYSKENKNEKFLSKYPKIKGYPHIFVLEKDGEFLHSQDTGDLEENKGYSKDKLTEFLNKWSR